MAKLSNIIIKNLKPCHTLQMIADDQARGLYLRVYAGGAKAFVMRSAKGLKTLGRWPDEVTLAEARRIAHGDGKTKAFMYNKQTVGHLAKEFYDKQIEPRYRRPEQTWAYLERDLTTIASKRVVDVTLGDLATLIGAKVKDGPVAANRLLAVVKKMFRFAVKTGVIQADPAALLDRSIAGGREVARERVLNDDELRKFWVATAPGQGTPWGPKHGHGPLLRFLLLTGQRLKETHSACWSDIDFEKRRWNIPAENTKSGRPHWVHLPDLAIDILKSIPRDTDRVFAKRSLNGSHGWLRAWCKREGVVPFWPHDLRRTVSTRMNELGVPPYVVEKVLAHLMEGTMSVYNRATYETERVEAQELWAKALTGIIMMTTSSVATGRSRPSLKIVSR